MSAPVNVLAVMDEDAEFIEAVGEIAEELREARAAVAELIAADKEYDATRDTGDYLRMKAAAERRAAALARVTGGQP